MINIQKVVWSLCLCSLPLPIHAQEMKLSQPEMPLLTIEMAPNGEKTVPHRGKFIVVPSSDYVFTVVRLSIPHPPPDSDMFGDYQNLAIVGIDAPKPPQPTLTIVVEKIVGKKLVLMQTIIEGG